MTLLRDLYQTGHQHTEVAFCAEPDHSLIACVLHPSD